MTIPTFSTPPARTDAPDVFISRADQFLSEFPAFVTAANTDIATANASVTSAVTSAATATTKAAEAAASALSANGAAGAAKWVSGTTYAEGVCAWSPTNYLTYRRRVAGAGTTDPISDATNWALVFPDYVPAINPKAMSKGVALTAAESGATGIAVADNANIDLGTGNATLHWEGSLPDWSAGSALGSLLISKFATGLIGYQLWTTLAGKFAVCIYRNTNGSSVAQGFYSTTLANSFADGTTHKITAVIVRETATANGSIVIYLDGVLLETITIDYTTAVNAGLSIDNTGSLYVLGSSTARYAGICQSAILYNRVLSAAEVLSLCNNGVAESDKDGSQTERVTNGTFTGSATGWTLGAGFAYGTDNVTITAASNTNMSQAVGLVANARYRLKFTISNYTSGAIGAVYGLNSSTFGALRSANGTYTEEVTTPASMTNTGLFLAVGTAAVNMTIDDVSLVRIGTTLRLEPEGINPNQWHDSGANDLHALYPSAGSSLTRWKETGQYNWTTAIAGDTTLTSIVPAGYELEKILFKNSTAGAVSVRLGTTAGGTDVFGLTALNTSATFGGYKTISVNQGFSTTAAQTLYLSSTDWTGGGTPPSLIFTMYFRRIS